MNDCKFYDKVIFLKTVLYFWIIKKIFLKKSDPDFMIDERLTNN